MNWLQLSKKKKKRLKTWKISLRKLEGICQNLARVINTEESSNLSFKEYVDLRSVMRECHLRQWSALNGKIMDLIQKTEDLTPEVIEDVKDAHEFLSDYIIPTIFPDKDPDPKNFDELKRMEMSHMESIPEALRKLFNKIFFAYLKTSTNNALTPEEPLYILMNKFNNENAEKRYPETSDPKMNPYLYTENEWSGDQKRDWRKKANYEFYHYYDGVLSMLNSMRNFQIHKEDAFPKKQFNKLDRKISDPISGIENPANYLVLGYTVILSIYTFIEILQIWVDTHVKISKN
jgi:hypothetical protein